MDNEALSDCSESSKNSGYFLSSRTSTLSDLSVYEGEFLELKKAIDSDKNEGKNKNDVTPKINRQSGRYVQNLHSQVETLMKENEKFRQELHDLEKKTALFYNKKLENLLQRNVQLEENLKSANNHIQRLISICGNRDSSANVTTLEEKILSLERKNHDLNLQNHSLSKEFNNCNYQKCEIENVCKELKTRVNELSLELAAKEECVTKLKEKILEQHVELQTALQNNIKLKHTIDSLSNELEHVTKSEQWYKKELNQVQTEKNKLTTEILEKNKILANQSQKLEHLNLELNKSKCNYDEMRLSLLKEKEFLLKQIESVHNNVDVTNQNTNLDIQSITNFYERTIKELTDEVSSIIINFENQQNCFDELKKQYSDMLAKYLGAENSIKEKNNIIDKLEKDVEDKKMELVESNKRKQEHETCISHLKSLNIRLETELAMKVQEKDSVEETVKMIKDQFQIFKKKYEIVKEEIQKKNEEILQFKVQNEQVKRQSEDIKVKDIEITDLKEKLSVANRIQIDQQLEISTKQQEYERVIDENVTLKKTLEEIESKYLNLQREHDVAAENMIKESMNNERENASERNCETNNELIRADLSSNSETIQNVTNFVVNNYANIDPYNVNIAYIILEYICKLCKIDDYSSFLQKNFYNKYDKNPAELVKELLSEIDKCFHIAAAEANNDKNKNFKKQVTRLKTIVSRIDRLEKKCKILESKIEENENVLLKLLKGGDEHEKIKHLHALLEVKNREQKDKQKRYETNYHTLLKKVKEHMKGRNIAEKHNLQLQELYNSLSDECNNLRLQIHSKNSEIDTLKNNIEILEKSNEKEKLCSKPCEQCIEFELLKQHEMKLEESLKSSQCFKEKLVQDLKLKEEVAHALTVENKELLFKISSLDSKYKECIVKIETLIENNKEITHKLKDCERKLFEEKSTREKFEAELSLEKQSHFKIQRENQNLSLQIEKMADRNSHLLKKVEFINSCLQQKDEEFKELTVRKEQSEIVWTKKENNMQNVITALKTQLQLFKTEIDRMKSEKFFLQRLCNDLKVALKVHVGHNKALKDYIANSISEEKEKWNKALKATSNFPCPAKYDDKYIENLLKANSAPVEKTPLSDVQECLDSLRREIGVLQKQIIEKNIAS